MIHSTFGKDQEQSMFPLTYIDLINKFRCFSPENHLKQVIAVTGRTMAGPLPERPWPYALF